MDLNHYAAGFARLDITPPLGIPLAGSWNPKPADGILDPLQVNAIAFRQGNTAAILLTLDLLGLYAPKCATWPAQVAA